MAEPGFTKPEKTDDPMIRPMLHLKKTLFEIGTSTLQWVWVFLELQHVSCLLQFVARRNPLFLRKGQQFLSPNKVIGVICQIYWASPSLLDQWAPCLMSWNPRFPDFGIAMDLRKTGARSWLLWKKTGMTRTRLGWECGLTNRTYYWGSSSSPPSPSPSSSSPSSQEPSKSVSTKTSPVHCLMQLVPSGADLRADLPLECWSRSWDMQRHQNLEDRPKFRSSFLSHVFFG